MKRQATEIAFRCLVTIAIVSTVSHSAYATMFGIDWASQTLFTVDLATAATVPVGNASPLRNGLAFDVDGTLYSNDRGLFGTINPWTAAPTVVNPATGRDLNALAFTSDFSALYGIDFLDDNLYLIDKTTGVGTIVGSTGLDSLSSLAINSSNEAFVADTSIPGVLNGGNLYKIDLSTGGVIATVGDMGHGMTSMAFDNNDNLFGIGLSHDVLYRIDTSTAVATPIGNVTYRDVRGLAWVPEPSTLVLLCMGAVGLLVYFLRRRK